MDKQNKTRQTWWAIKTRTGCFWETETRHPYLFTEKKAARGYLIYGDKAVEVRLVEVKKGT